jgi:DNA-directed RNA polymerase specialized sigma24 family protein
MSHLPREWRFLKAAWVYALVVTGSAQSASEKLLVALSATVARLDVAFSRRRRRFLLAKLHRDCAGVQADSGQALDASLETFRKIPEPGRSALLMLYLRLLPADEIADVLRKSEKELPDILTAARANLESALEHTP